MSSETNSLSLFQSAPPTQRLVGIARLASLGEIEEEEFYAPTTRFDVVEIAVDTLRAKMQDDGNGDVTFGPEDYART